jgi:hypothetical protein
MSVITAYKCDTTGKLFEDKAKYQKHIRKIAYERRVQRKIDAAHKADLQWWHDNFWNRVKSLAQLQAAILHHKDVFAARGVKNYFSGIRDKLKPTPIIKFKTFQIRYRDSVSNSHNCPHDGVTNFSQSYNRQQGKNIPEGYPGWQGRFDYTVQSHDKQLHSYPGRSEMWIKTRIHTGTGGGGGANPEEEKLFLQNFGYDVKLFASDWPAMAEEYEKANVFKILVNDQRSLDQIVNEWHPAESFTPVSEMERELA